jgi:hypothetical protein
LWGAGSQASPNAPSSRWDGTGLTVHLQTSFSPRSRRAGRRARVTR